MLRGRLSFCSRPILDHLLKSSGLSVPASPSWCCAGMMSSSSSVAMSSSPVAIATSKSPAALGAYSQAIRCPQNASLLFVSGQLGLEAETSAFSTPESLRAKSPCSSSSFLPSDISSPVEAQTYTAMVNLANILSAAGATTAQLVKTTILLTDMSHFATVNKIYASFFPSTTSTAAAVAAPPARACFAVKELPKQALVEIEGVAAI
eukprot:GHVS01046951.1.p1 GENE.GHVS01046951.1~~GHVS01046951.1.p1  ORF type:complete len:206 (-),score=45.38 GHVS01046951.1:120-737(-)